MSATEIVSHWLFQIDRVPPGDWVHIADFDAFPSRARTESRYWCKTVFSPSYDPHLGDARARHAYHAAGSVHLDLLRHDYAHAGAALTLFEGVNFLILQLPERTGLPWSRDAIATALRGVLNEAQPKRHWDFTYPPQLHDGSLISTDPNVDPSLMHSWGERVDVLVHGGKLFVVVYKRYPSILGFVHDAQWFEDEVRADRTPR